MKSKLALFAASVCAALVGNAAVIVVNVNNAGEYSGTFTGFLGGEAVETSSPAAAMAGLTSFNIDASNGTDFVMFGSDGGPNLGEASTQPDLFTNDNFTPPGPFTGSFGAISYTYTISGSWLGNGADGVEGTFSFTVVPEPSEYAAIAGAALIGFAAWRRSRSKVA